MLLKKDLFNKLELCKKVYLENHPEMKEVYISNHKLAYIIIKYYLEGTKYEMD